jgi:predicted phage terminase large subunit-like protein
VTPEDLTRAAAASSLYRFARLAWRHTEIPGGTPFAGSWHLEELCRAIESFHRREPRDLVINVPPATGKSLFSGVFYPAWIWSKDPSHRFIYVSYDAALLNRDSGTLAGLLRSEWYRRHWGDVLAPGPTAVGNLVTVAGGGRLNTSIRGKGTGWHCHTLVVDDPNKAQDAFASPANLEFAWTAINTTFSNRTTDPATFGRLIIGQRLSSDDVTARAVDAGWSRLSLPMRYVHDSEAAACDRRTAEGEPLFPSRFPEPVLAELESTLRLLGTWEAQYQQRPVRTEGTSFDPAWIDVVPKDSIPYADGSAIQSWDLTFKGNEASDWIAGQWWIRSRDDHFFMAAPPVFRRASFTETVATIAEHSSAWPASRVLIEDKANGPACEDVLRDAVGGIELVNPEGSKEARFVGTTPLWRSGRVHVIDGPHVERMRREWPRFPRIARDDDIDAASQALRYLSRGAGYTARLMALLGRG